MLEGAKVRASFVTATKAFRDFFYGKIRDLHFLSDDELRECSMFCGMMSQKAELELEKRAKQKRREKPKSRQPA
jgi:hypothetical protein